MESRKEFIINAIYFSLVLGSVYLLVKYVVPAFMPFLLAFLVASLIHVIVKRLPVGEGKKRKRVAIVTTALFYILIAAGIVLLANGFLILGEKAIEVLPNLFRDEIIPWVHSVAERLEARYGNNSMAGLDDIGDKFMNGLRDFGQQLSQISMDKMIDVSDHVVKIPGFFIKVVIMVVATFFIAADYKKVTFFLMGFFSEKGQKRIRSVKFHLLEMLHAYLKSYSVLMLITFVELWIGLLILQVPYAVVIAFGVALFDILPVFGTGGILIPWAVFSFLLGNYKMTIGLIVLDLVITIARNILEPKIVGKQIGLHPLITLVALFVGLKLFGVVGIFLFPIAISVVIQMAKNEEI